MFRRCVVGDGASLLSYNIGGGKICQQNADNVLNVFWPPFLTAFSFFAALLVVVVVLLANLQP
jgi:hypothetical protein